MKPHYLWKEDIPEGRLHDYIIASASAFPAVHRYRIDGKDYIDGGYENVIPIHMAWERGADKVIAVYLKAPGKFIPDEIRFASIVRVHDVGAALDSFRVMKALVD